MNRKPILTILSMILILSFVLTACGQPAATPAPAPDHRGPCGTDRCARSTRTDQGAGTHRGPGRADQGARTHRGS